MSVPPTPEKPKAKRAPFNRGGMYVKTVEKVENRAAARALYESRPGMTITAVAEETGLPEGTLRRWKMEDQWQPAHKTMPDLAGRAGQLANTFKVKMSELGKPLSDEVAAAEVAKEVSNQEAIDVRAGVLDRHRKEWGAPRKLIYEAVQKRDFELAKLAKITSETLQIVQVGECRAFGLDHAARGGTGGTVVVVEREALPEPQDPPAQLPPAAEPSETSTGGAGEEF